MNRSNSTGLSSLECAVLKAALSGEKRELAVLRAQAEAATVASRTPSGVGFVAKLQLPESFPRAENSRLPPIPVVYGEHPHLPGGAEFLLQIKNGRINCIEAFCYEGMWPADESLFRVSVR